MITVLLNAIKALHISMEKEKIYKLLLIGLSSLFLCSIMFYYVEGAVNTELSLGDAFWWGFVTVTTVGYGDYFPLTLGGRLIAGLLMLIGISTFGFLTAAVASFLVENKLKEGMGLMDLKFKNHIVIIGWNKKSEIMLKELVGDNPDRKVIIVSEIERLTFETKNTYFVHGDPTLDETLIRANISEADIALIVADDKLKDNNGMADARSVLICLAIDKLNPTIHIIAEVLNEENVPHFERANVNDIIISNQMSSRVMVRSAVYRNVSVVLKELLTNSYGNELYESAVRDDDIGLTFKELSSKYISYHHAVILGIADEKVHLNPTNDRKIKKDDVIIYISNVKL
ncbi:hypothetical protein SH2C18_14050 [Clostridium sediminicola]|uniref:potassium channel family protein n=1 Tax=Clostridium sediminicola TaxID=3114879 RepID=UPI0031F25BA4